jgi:L-glyceraldehyde 3-phosphate reductase
VRSHDVEQRRAILSGLHRIATARDQSLPQMALAWNLRDPRITAVVVGATRPEQVRANIAALDHLEFGDDELAAIDELTLDKRA